MLENIFIREIDKRKNKRKKSEKIYKFPKIRTRNWGRKRGREGKKIEIRE